MNRNGEWNVKQTICPAFDLNKSVVTVKLGNSNEPTTLEFKGKENSPGQFETLPVEVLCYERGEKLYFTFEAIFNATISSQASTTFTCRIVLKDHKGGEVKQHEFTNFVQELEAVVAEFVDHYKFPESLKWSSVENDSARTLHGMMK